MESPLSQDSSHMFVETLGEHNLLKFMFFQGYWLARAGWLRLAIHVWPSTSDGHNFFVRTSFQVFLDFMENLLSRDSSHMPMEDSG